MLSVVKTVDDPESLKSPDDNEGKKASRWVVKEGEATDDDGHYARTGVLSHSFRAPPSSFA